MGRSDGQSDRWGGLPPPWLQEATAWSLLPESAVEFCLGALRSESSSTTTPLVYGACPDIRFVEFQEVGVRNFVSGLRLVLFGSFFLASPASAQERIAVPDPSQLPQT